jgi:hypothetical protein
VLTGGQELMLLRTAWSSFTKLYEYWRAGRIQITSPRSSEALKPFANEGRISYEVRGKLKRLPKNHEIWLLTEHSTGCVWPQEKAEFNRDTGEWEGRIATNEPHQKIVAVVAPPTSQQFFKYYKLFGNGAALYSIPVECRSTDSVDARLP